MRVLVTDSRGQVIEVVNWNRKQPLVRPAADKLIEADERPEIGVGWTYTATGWLPPTKQE